MVTIVNAFQNIFGSSKRNSNKIWVNKDSEYYDNYFKKWLMENDIKICSTHNTIMLPKNLLELQKTTSSSM